MTITYRELGDSGLKVSPLAFGGNVFGWTSDEKTSFALLDDWVAKGFNFIDTANMYSTWVPGHQGGESESIIGKWLKQSCKRESVVIASKVGMEMVDGSKGLKADYILKEVDASLKRLQTDYIDLYYAHIDDPETPLEETLGTFDALIKAGKVRAIGASNYSGARLQQALDVSQQNRLARYEVLQPIFNLYDRDDFEKDLLPVVEANKLGVSSYYSLASGFLSGKYRSSDDAGKSPRGQGIVAKYLNPRGTVLLEKLDYVAERYETSPATVALAWAIAAQGITAPIVSASNVDQLPPLYEAVELELDADALEELSLATDPDPTR